MQQFGVMLTQLTFFFVFETSTSKLIWQTTQTCATRLSSLEKETKILLDKEVPSHERCLQPCSTKQRSRLLICPKLLWQIGLPSFGSQVCAAPSTHRKPNQLLTNTASLKHSSQAIGNFSTASRVINVNSIHGEPKEFLAKLRIIFQIQKNRQNGQKINLVANNDHANICPVRAAYRIFLRSKRLGQLDSEPMAVFVNKFGITRYLAGGKIADVLQSVAKAVHPDLSADKIKHFSSHLTRAWALVLLDKAGMTPDFMTSRLRWMGESYKLYLRNTSVLQHKHVNALKKESNQGMWLLGCNRDILPNIVPMDDEMGEY